MDKQKINQSRRSFIKKGAASLAGVSMIPLISKADKESKIIQEKNKSKMIIRTLGKTGIKLPIVSMGSFQDANLVEIALDLGIVHIDTAAVYQNGNHERMLGEVFKNRPRDSFVIATANNTQSYFDKKTGLLRKGVKAEFLINDFEGSLKRLGLDYIDIYYLGVLGNKKTTLFEPFMKIMEKFKKEGKTRFIGVTTHNNEPEVIRAAVESKVYDVVLTSYNFRQKHKEEVKKAIDYAADAGLGIVAMKTQAGVYWDKERKNMINMKAALKWALQDKNVHTAIPGFNSYNEIVEGLSVMENLTLTPKEKQDLKIGDEMGHLGLYCQQCGECISQCKWNFDIPTIMRSYMYAYGYKNPFKARETIGQVNFSRIGCNDCSICTIKCTMGFDVREKVLDIIRIKEIPIEFLV
jgi:predicted aldo/keto reductase-like oxidoreductase